MKYVFIIIILGCLGAGAALAADPVTDPDQYNRAAYLPVGKETSATCGPKNLQACHGTCIPKDQLCLNVPIAGKNTFPSFQEYFQAIYSFILGAVAILSTVMIMWGGFKWLTSRGSSGDIGEAKKIITSSIIGLVLAFLSFTILYLVNPKLTVIGLPQLKTVEFTVNEAKLDYFPTAGEHSGTRNTTAATAGGGAQTPKVPCTDDQTLAYIASYEGYSSTSYPDAIKPGTYNIGYGHHTGSAQSGPIDEAEAIQLFQADRAKAQNDAAQIFGSQWSAMGVARQAAFTDMVYNMGSGAVRGFTQMVAAVNTGNYTQAADEILNSRYAQQLPQRAANNAAIIRNNDTQLYQQRAQPNCQ